MTQPSLIEPALLPIARLQACWTDLNRRYFHGVLPPIRIEWSPRLTSSAGMFISRVGPRRHRIGHERRLIRLSAPLLGHQSERDIISTLAHEMIHQWQFDVLKRRPRHSPDFLRKMELMNRAGLGITVLHELHDQIQAFVKYAWRCQHCGTDYHRQRRTIRPRVHRCGHCRGPLREVPVVQLELPLGLA